ncbi:hypothetical protein CTAYLR_006819 [Chrysophaeum taylorii]|uniref:Centrosomal protein of 19 kDa n=1 Tax=Chrysophaeum taylorii TaxID=2483200 RepID=A0AAD7UCA7_9STRA|nr:hypothetical protein CTAYLR_006819 [Chrysophaeum taylorii]
MLLQPQRVAVKYAPPTIIVEYAGASGELKHYTIRLKNVRRDMDPEKITLKLFARHPRYLDPTKLKHGQIQRLVEKLLASMKSDADHNGCSKPGGDEEEEDDGVDLNRCSEFQLQRAKARMDVDFDRHRVGRDDDAFVYDKQQEFEDAVEDSGWDDDDDDDA